MEKHRDMEDEGKGDGHQHELQPRIPEPVSTAWNSPSEEVIGHWTPTGCGPKDIPYLFSGIMYL